MTKLSKRIVTCMLSGLLIWQPTAFNVSDGFMITAEAHSGRTDSSGGHNDNKNKSGLGSYHYHCGGYPAHLHDGGVCPYSSAATSGNSVSNSEPSSNSSTQSVASEPSNIISMTGKSIKLSTGEKLDLSKDLVKLVQDVLNQKGYDCGTADGIIGEKTKDAIKKYLDESDDKDTDFMIISMICEGLEIE